MQEKILIVDDDPHILQSHKRHLRNDFIVDIATGGQNALDMIKRKGPYAVVVSDMQMPEVDGLQLLSCLKELQPDTIRIMLTGNADQKTAVDAVNKGDVFRFLTKPCSSETMKLALKEGLVQYGEVQQKKSIMEKSFTEISDLSEKLEYQSRYDHLTGLVNRQTFEQKVQSALELSRREGRSYALCNIDLDNFHVINDTCGYFAGDECLRQVSNMISLKTRDSDVVSRLAANQFAVLLADCFMEEAKQVVYELHERFRKFVFHWQGEALDINTSIGFVSVDSNSDSVAAVLGAAETACNVAKDRGKNKVHVAEPGDVEFTQRLNASQWVKQINNAIKQDRFILYYQRITGICNTAEKGDHFEVLVRMVDERGEVILPEAFLATAENYFLSPQIDRWVIRNIVDWFNRKPQQLEQLSMCSINLSGHSVGSDDMLEFISTTFANSVIPTQKICFEITETAAITRLNLAVKFINSLKARGFRFSLDDFGSGFSSFAYLKNLPVDYLKIDGQFVKNIHQDPVSQAMIKSIAEIGKLMGKVIIAEYVENEQIMRILQKLGVDFGQGYYIHKPCLLGEDAKS